METRPRLSFVEAVKASIKLKENEKSRSRRSEFWWTTLACVVYSAIVDGLGYYFIHLRGIESEGLRYLFTLLNLPVIFTWFPVAYRRLHDIGKSGFMLNLSIWLAVAAVCSLLLAQWLPEAAVLPIYYALAGLSTVTSIILLVWCTRDSQKGPNKYGPSPKYYEPGEDIFSTSDQHAPETQTEKSYDQCLDELQKETLKHELDKNLRK